MILIPVVPLDRLVFVTGSNPIEAIFRLDEHPLALEAVQFTFIQATLSALLTLARSADCMVAWTVRMEAYWFDSCSLNPAIRNANRCCSDGLLALINQGGILASLGIDLRNETGFIGSLSASSASKHGSHHRVVACSCLV